MNNDFNQNGYEAVKDNLTPLIEVSDVEDFEIDESFTYDGFQVVRGEFFAHIFEPSITFNNNRLSVNMACINKLPSVDYVQALVNSKEKKIVIKPSTEDVKDSYMWCTYARKDNKRRPKQVTCKVFFHKIFELMEWNHDYRYKILGKMIQSNGEYLLVFNLNDAEVYQRFYKDGERPVSSRTPVFPADWANQFGLSYDEHRKSLQVNIFQGYTVFGVKNNDKQGDTKLDNTESEKEDEPIDVDSSASFGIGGGNRYGY